MYLNNKLLAIYNSTKPTLTDQAGANETDINIIVGRMGISGHVPGNNKEPMQGDFTQFPADLRSMIETSRSIENVRKRLPQQLAELPMERLLTLTPDEITNILTPPAPTPEPKGEPK